MQVHLTTTALHVLQEAALEADPQAFLSKEYGVTLSKEYVRKLQQMVKAIQEERPAHVL